MARVVADNMQQYDSGEVAVNWILQEWLQVLDGGSMVGGQA